MEFTSVQQLIAHTSLSIALNNRIKTYPAVPWMIASIGTNVSPLSLPKNLSVM